MVHNNGANAEQIPPMPMPKPKLRYTVPSKQGGHILPDTEP